MASTPVPIADARSIAQPAIRNPLLGTRSPLAGRSAFMRGLEGAGGGGVDGGTGGVGWGSPDGGGSGVRGVPAVAVCAGRFARRRKLRVLNAVFHDACVALEATRV